ncbi:alpha/beta hydrolase [Terrisporobacter sp.]|uniref:alpha/beta hydrolase n=1 Tax=Terrisporobacter sp. TaxID=1965305 RepID=UPI002A82D63D|nr:alpha/beta hydrolase [Terrisporobacter sp.]MCI5628119.1 alpha/beta hydrolase [Clostridium sp.]MCI6457771.1 alpha/beta hydrolase [Clostridium sp.]MCI7204904.1 alpha/beta hydrolase [Clostridium sp.]MDY4736032.1 alpha/beta hydrolase [Terrisporobacter sp.]
MFIFLFIVFLIVILILFYISFRLYNFALNPKSSKEGIFNSKDNNEPRFQDTWIYDYKDKEDVFINSFDNLKLHGYILKTENSDKWAITVHGYTNKAESMSAMAYKYHSLGYNILMPDLRGHGKSEGSYVGMGWHDRLDILKWIDLIIKENKDAKILLHGISMGAGTVMMVSGEELPENVKVIIEDCGYTSAKEQLAYNLKTMFKLPSFPILNFCSLITKIKDNYFISEASAIKQLQKAKVPILFIHGDKDKFVPFYMLDKLYNACSSKKDKLIIKDVGHAKSESLKSDLYWNKVEDFIKPYM